MKPALKVLTAGPGATLQDAGRRGYLRFGVTAAGPMDALAMATANLAVGSPAGATAIEVSLGGIEVTAVDLSLPVAVAGGLFDISVDGERLPAAVRLALTPGATLRVRAGSDGAWCYIAIGGSVDIPPVLRSNATHVRSALGGIDGRALSAGDLLPIRDARPCATGAAALVAPWLHASINPIRVILGPQADYFSPPQIETLCSAVWTVSNRSDRMAYFLDGPPVVPSDGLDIVSDGIVMGAIQVLGDGRPMVLMADRQVTGGYPKIATVIGPDLGRFAQRRPGAAIRFAAVTVDTAVAARRAAQSVLAAPIQTAPWGPAALCTDALIEANLISGVTAGGDGSAI